MLCVMAWGFLTNHAQALLCIARDPGVRLREIASTLGITERAAFGIVTDLVEAGYVGLTSAEQRAWKQGNAASAPLPVRRPQQPLPVAAMVPELRQALRARGWMASRRR